MPDTINYSKEINMLKNEVINLGKGGAYGLINPLEIIMDADEEDIKNGQGYAVLNTTLQNLKAFMKYYSPDIEDDVLNMFSEVVQDTYARFGINFNSDFSKYKSKDFPIIDKNILSKYLKYFVLLINMVCFILIKFIIIF